ncbi:unnamed protein product [Paramecium pentaurelia]|uniref:TtsA-like Glycoside hydrolase family 108 domain-containing protein n=1 Tax=Paramecium pentaurelia TaxID=43138 RepID=A0A8S1XKY6_9CILI|nr:unnamed protein product [Paramecium pentaurelia]
MSVFDVILKLILEHEGGKCNRVHDSGGKTNRGITQSTYDYECGQMMENKKVKPEDRFQYKDVYDLTDQEVYKFYKYLFNKCSANQINNPETCYVFFDAVINHGQGGAIKCLQHVCNLKEDGIFGPNTEAMANSLNQKEIQKKMLIYRENQYKKSKNYEYNKNGWNNRLNKIRQQIEKGIMPNLQQNYNNYQFVQQQQVVNKPKQDPVKYLHEAIKMQQIPDLTQFEIPIQINFNQQVPDAFPLFNQYKLQRKK